MLNSKFIVTGSLLVLVDLCNAFVCRWILANQSINQINQFNLYRAEKRNRKDCVGGDSGDFFGCFVGKFITWNGRMARDPLNGGGGVNGIVN